MKTFLWSGESLFTIWLSGLSLMDDQRTLVACLKSVKNLWEFEGCSEPEIFDQMVSKILDNLVKSAKGVVRDFILIG